MFVHLVENSQAALKRTFTFLFSGRHALRQCLFHFPPPFFSHSPSPTTSIKYLSSVAFCLSLAAFSSPVNSSFSQFSPLPASSTVSPLPRLLLLALIAALHLLPLLSLCPIIAPFNPAVLCFHSTRLAVSIWVTTSHCVSTPVPASILKPPFSHCTICIC